MIFDLSLTLKAGKLQNDHKNQSLSLKFSGNSDIQLFCIQLKESFDKQNTGFFNRMIGTIYADTLGDIRIDNAGMIFMNQSLSSTSFHNISSRLPACLLDSINALITEKDFLSQCSFFIWFEAKLQNLHFLNNLIKIGYAENKDFLFLTWLSKKEGSENTSTDIYTKYFYAQLPDIMLFHIFKFIRPCLKVLLEPNIDYYAIWGQINLTINNTSLSFSGDLEFYNTGYNASLQCNLLQKAFVPLETMDVKLNLEQVNLKIKHLYKTFSKDSVSEYYLSATIEIAGITTNGELHFQDERITSASIQLDTGDISLSDIWNWLFPSIVWDKEVFDLAFKQGSYLKYKSLTNNDGSKTTTYQIALKTNIILIKPFNLSGKLDLTEKKLTASMEFSNPIDFGFLVFENSNILNTTTDSSKEPEFSFSFSKSDKAEHREMNIFGKISFLDQTILDGSAQYITEKNKWMLKATLPAPDILKDILGQKITILYSSETGFSLSAPGIDSFENDAFNFVDEFEKYLKVEKNGCKKLNFQKNRKKLKVQYKTEILNSTDINQKQCKNSCCFTISGKLSVCKENGQEILKQDILPGISIELKKGTTAEEIFSQFEDVVSSILDSFLHILFTTDIDTLKEILLILVGDEIKEYAQNLLCRKLIKNDTFEKLTSEKPGGSSSSSGGRGEFSGSMAAEGGAAFGAGQLFSDAGFAFAGAVLIFLFPGGDSSDSPEKDKPLPCPEFYGKIENGQLYIEIEDLKYAEKYEIDLFWEVENYRYDKTYEYDRKTPFPEISLIAIPVLGKLYLAVRAIHQNEELSSDWSEGNYLTDVTAEQLIQWAWNADLCLRDCFLMLKQHGVDLSKDTTMLSVTNVYGQPDSKDTIAKRHYNSGDDIEQCYTHLNRTYPNLSTKELIQCLWMAGYHDDQIRLTVYKYRHIIKEKEINEIFLFLFHEKKGVFMTMNEKLSFLINMRQTKGLSPEQWRGEIAEIYANYDPIELAKILKNVLNFDAKEIADSLKNIDVQYKAITVGGILLHNEIYPDTSRENMLAILKETFPDENIEKAIQILYPTTIRVLASIPWNDTGIIIEQDEYVQIEYLSGRWSVNPQWGFCSADGNRSLIAKPGYLLPGESEGCLVAKIESSSNIIRKIGLKEALPKADGRLYLGANDDINAQYGVGYKDNFGEIQVVVRKKLR